MQLIYFNIYTIMKHVFLILFLCVYSLSLQGQKKQQVKKNQGIFNITEIGYLPGSGNINYDVYTVTNDARTYRLRSIFGYFINPHLSVGVGIGLDGYHEPDHNTMPLFIECRGYLKDQRNTFYGFLDLGKSLGVNETFRSGLFLNSGVGYKFFLTKRWCLNSSLGFNLQQMQDIEMVEFVYDQETDEYYANWKQVDIYMKAVSFNLAFHFNIFTP